jgi:hypothetical protein
MGRIEKERVICVAVIFSSHRAKQTEGSMEQRRGRGEVGDCRQVNAVNESCECSFSKCVRREGWVEIRDHSFSHAEVSRLRIFVAENGLTSFQAIYISCAGSSSSSWDCSCCWCWCGGV